MESVFQISGYAIENQVKFATCTLLGAALTWWNGQIRTLGPDAYTMTWEILKKKITNKYCPQVLTTRPTCHPSLISCLPSLEEYLPSILDAYGQSLEALPSQSATSGSESHVPMLTTRPTCHPSLISCLPSLEEYLPSILDAYGQSLEALPSQSATSGSESHVPGPVSE
nr:reverse transcriptase domain-containing protein [Tanacetum cinerariifolium]